MSSPSALNPRAQTGFSKASFYDQHRPTYSPYIVQFLLEQLGVAGKHGAVIVDLAAGTGKFTELLAARKEKFRVIAVEPHDGMREVLEGKKFGDGSVSVVKGMADSMPGVKEGSVDAVVVAQAFHWFANMSSLREIHRILQPHGALGMVWNVEDYNAPRSHQASTPWEATAHNLTWQVADDSGDTEPRFRHLQWKKVFDEQVKKSPLSLLRADQDQLFSLPIAEHSEPFETALPTEKVWERYQTLGHVAVLEGERLERTKNIFMDAISAEDVDKDAAGNVVVHGNTYAVWTTKIPEEGRESLTVVEQPGDQALAK